MKKLIYILIVLAFSACTDKLDLVPVSSKNIEGFYKTEDQFYQAIMGCYDGVQNAMLKQNFSYMMTESRSDNAWQQVDYDDGLTSRFTENAELSILNTAWATLYKYIARCNYVLGSLEENTELGTDLKNQFEGEARFMRALFYFELVRFFGEVPLVDKVISIDEGYALQKSSVEDIYDFIVSDLKLAAGLLPHVKPSANPNRATAMASRGFLGKVYVFRSGYPLNKSEWGLASAELKAVLDGVGEAGFLENYSDIFDINNEGGEQAIFSIGCKSGAEGEGNPFPTRNGPNGIYPGNDPLMIPYGGSPMQLFLDDYILGSLFDEPGDLRFDYSIQTEWIEKSKDTIRNWPFCKKYQSGPVAAGSDWDIDWILLRYTDVYMLYAEAQYHQGQKGDALTILNKVRKRADLPDLSAADIDTDDEFINVLLRERRKEFCFENQRWFDLVRTDKALDIMKPFLTHYGSEANFTSRDRYFYPVPQQETDITGVE